MFKFKFDLQLTEQELTSAIKPRLQTAVAKTSAKLKANAQKMAQSSLKKGLSKWLEGLSLDRVSDDVYVLSVNGKLANMIEEGFTGDELKSLILNGRRAAHNKAQGKNYVDVPFALSSDDISKQFSVSMTELQSAPAALKTMEVSDYKANAISEKNVVVQRIKDVIRTRTAEGAEGIKTSVVTIKRVTHKSKLSGWKGVKILNSSQLLQNLSKDFEDSLKESF